jgi:hypothetical protein
MGMSGDIMGLMPLLQIDPRTSLSGTSATADDLVGWPEMTPRADRSEFF